MRRGKKYYLPMLLMGIIMILLLGGTVSASSSVSAPKYLRVESRGNKSAVLRWSKSSNISGYTLYQYDNTTGKFKEVKTISKSSNRCTVRGLEAGKKYRYMLKAFVKKNGKKVYSKASNKVEFTAKELSESVLSIRRPRYTVKTKRKVTLLNQTTKEKITLKKGTKLAVTAKNGNKVNGYLQNGDRVYIKRSYLTYTGLDVSSKKDYTKAVKQEFVNSKGYGSETDWLIWVSERTLKVYIYKGSRENWKLQKTFPCCIGKWKTRTASGIRKILAKGTKWDYGAPWIYFSSGDGDTSNPSGCAFHNKPDSRIGQAISNGCVRMNKSDLMYIYNNCPVGTRVVVY